MRLNLANKISLSLVAFIAVLGAVLFFSVRQIVTNELVFIIKKTHSEHVLGHALHETTPEEWRNPKSGDAQETLKALSEEFFYLPDILRVKIWSPEFEIIYADPGAAGLIGKRFPENSGAREALEIGEVIFEREDVEEFVGKPEHVYDLELGGLFETYIPIVFPGQDKPVGAVEIYQSTAIFDALLGEIVRLLILIFVAGAAALFFLAFFVFEYFVHRPMKFLTNASQKIAGGDLDFEIKPLSKDELGDMTEHFDLMRRALKEKIAIEEEQREKAEKLNADLEQNRIALVNVLEEVEEGRKMARREKSKVEAVLTNINDAIVLTDNDGAVIVVNRQFEKMFDVSAEQIIEQPFDRFLELVLKTFGLEKTGNGLPVRSSKGAEAGNGNRELERYFRKAKASYAILEKELTMSHPFFAYGVQSGTMKPVFKLFTTPAWSLERTIMGRIWVFSDVTVQKEIERLRSEFISVTSHQLRTPLTGIKAFLEIVLGGDAGSLTAEQKDYLNEVYLSNERMVDLVEALLNVSRIESGRLALEFKPVDLLKLSDEVIKDVMTLIKQRHQKFVFNKPEELPPVNVDARLIFQVMSNLLTNASKYTPAEGTITLEIMKQEKEILFKVSDTGFGIPKDQQDKVFNKFFRGDNVVLLETGGSGLGLYIVKQFVEKHGGKIWFESEENKGTTFYVTLPLDRTTTR